MEVCLSLVSRPHCVSRYVHTFKHCFPRSYLSKNTYSEGFPGLKQWIFNDFTGAIFTTQEATAITQVACCCSVSSKYAKTHINCKLVWYTHHTCTYSFKPHTFHGKISGLLHPIFHNVSSVFQDQRLFPWLSRPQILSLKLREFAKLYKPYLLKSNTVKDKPVTHIPRSRSWWLHPRSSLASEQSASPSHCQLMWIHSELSQRKRFLAVHDDCDVSADVPTVRDTDTHTHTHNVMLLTSLHASLNVTATHQHNYLNL